MVVIHLQLDKETDSFKGCMYLAVDGALELWCEAVQNAKNTTFVFYTNFIECNHSLILENDIQS